MEEVRPIAGCFFERRMNIRTKTLLLTWLLAVPALGDVPTAVFNPDSLQEIRLFYWRYQRGDDMKWSQPTYDDAGWTSIRSFDYDLPVQEKGVYWLRSRVTTIKSKKEPTTVTLKIALLQSAYDVYWNGEFVGSNGIVGQTQGEEQPGNAVFVVEILPHTGENVLSIRLSNFHASTPSGASFSARLDPNIPTDIFTTNGLIIVLPFIGVCLAGILFGLALYAAGGRFKNYLYYALVCFGLIVARAVQFAVLYWNLPLDIVSVLVPIFVGGFYLTELAIVFFVLFSFGIPKRTFHIAVFSFFLVCFYVVNLNASYFKLLNYDWLRVAITPYVLSLLLYSAIRRKSGSVIALVGYALYSLPSILLVLEVSFPQVCFEVARYILLLSWIVVASRQVREQQELQKSIEGRAQRLETELLKKTIQPHFILNTLSSVKSLARREPEKADRLIQALASEFRILNDILTKKEIPIMQEIELCEYHLQVMGYRWDASYKFVKEGIPEKGMIPPLILHTLVENGLTHAFKPKESGTFWFTYKKQDGNILYCMQNDGSLLKGIRRTSNLEEGMGLKYVKARLEERYPKRWSVDYGVKESKWEVLIQIRDVR
jgi:hypothetical protein